MSSSDLIAAAEGDAWTTVRGGGRRPPVPLVATGNTNPFGRSSDRDVPRGGASAFSPEAAAAFGRPPRRAAAPPRDDFPSSSREGRRAPAFSPEAAAAFGRPPRQERREGGAGRSEFDEAAAAAFGRAERREGPREGGRGGGGGFDEAAASAFGGGRRRNEFSDEAASAFGGGKKNYYQSLSDEAEVPSGSGPRVYAKSALHRRAAAAAPAPAPPPKQTYDEAFPALGAPTAAKGGAAAGGASTAKPTFASLAKKLAVDEAAEAAATAAAASRAAAQRLAEAKQRDLYRRLHAISRGGSAAAADDVVDPEYDGPTREEEDAEYARTMGPGAGADYGDEEE